MCVSLQIQTLVNFPLSLRRDPPQHTHTHTVLGSRSTTCPFYRLSLSLSLNMQITDHSKEQVLLGVQRLRTMASSAASCMISPQPKVATDLSMSLSSSCSSKPIKATPTPPMQLELLPLYPSPSMVRSQQQQASPPSKLLFGRGQFDISASSFFQANRGADVGVNLNSSVTNMGLPPSLMQANLGLNPSLMHGNLGVNHPLSLISKGLDVGVNPSMRTSPHAGRGVDIDVNQVPSSSDSDEEDGEDEGGYPSLQLSESMNNNGMQRRSLSAMDGSPISLKRDREKMGSENNNNSNMYEVSSRASDEEENASTRKKLRLSKEQSALLEESFKEHSTLNPKQKNALAKQLNLRPRQVEVWFQNRRARTKLKQTEVDCELLKRCCESLTEENRRLQKEVQELRALKVGAPCVIAHDFYMPLPAATLTMCPSCERVATLDSAPRPSKQHLPPALTFNPHHPQPSAAC